MLHHASGSGLYVDATPGQPKEVTAKRVVDFECAFKGNPSPDVQLGDIAPRYLYIRKVWLKDPSVVGAATSSSSSAVVGAAASSSSSGVLRAAASFSSGGVVAAATASSSTAVVGAVASSSSGAVVGAAASSAGGVVAAAASSSSNGVVGAATASSSSEVIEAAAPSSSGGAIATTASVPPGARDGIASPVDATHMTLVHTGASGCDGSGEDAARAATDCDGGVDADFNGAPTTTPEHRPQKAGGEPLEMGLDVADGAAPEDGGAALEDEDAALEDDGDFDDTYVEGDELVGGEGDSDDCGDSEDDEVDGLDATDLKDTAADDDYDGQHIAGPVLTSLEPAQFRCTCPRYWAFGICYHIVMYSAILTGDNLDTAVQALPVVRRAGRKHNPASYRQHQPPSDTEAGNTQTQRRKRKGPTTRASGAKNSRSGAKNSRTRHSASTNANANAGDKGVADGDTEYLPG
eukprot:GHVU01230498.1.p1 GENE.GHVU01230498.1~~GHVU01230498.1.p1  ORF type:complete len:463 (-),score=73.60 GHVU01230498.1:700-2088(-)